MYMLWRSGHIHTNTEGGFGIGIFLITRPEHGQDSIFSHSIARGMVDSYIALFLLHGTATYSLVPRPPHTEIQILREISPLT